MSDGVVDQLYLTNQPRNSSAIRLLFGYFSSVYSSFHIIPRSIFHLLHLGHVYCSVLSCVCQLFIKEFHDDDDDDEFNDK